VNPVEESPGTADQELMDLKLAYDFSGEEMVSLAYVQPAPRTPESPDLSGHNPIFMIQTANESNIVPAIATRWRQKKKGNNEYGRNGTKKCVKCRKSSKKVPLFQVLHLTNSV
jgi:hypothetical protein